MEVEDKPSALNPHSCKRNNVAAYEHQLTIESTRDVECFLCPCSPAHTILRKQQLLVLMSRVLALLPHSVASVYLCQDKGTVSASVKATPMDTSESAYHVVVRTCL